MPELTTEEARTLAAILTYGDKYTRWPHVWDLRIALDEWSAVLVREWVEGLAHKGLLHTDPETSMVVSVKGYRLGLVKVEENVSERSVRVCLCGSTRFADAFIKAQRDETLAGKIVLSVGLFGHQEGLDMNGPVKAMLDRLHLAKIDLADEVLVLNVGGYIGESTRREIAYATEHGKPVRYLEEQANG